MKNQLRPYQQKDKDSIILEWKKNNSLLYQLPTGGGKSVVIENIVLDFKDEKILILAHKRELVFQMKRRLEERGLKVGIIIGSIEENINSNILIASVRTVTRDKRIDFILSKKFDRIFVDEAHHIRTSSYENVIDKYQIQNPKLKLLGVTATPYRKDRKPLNKYFNTLICGESVAELQKQGYLANFKTFYTPVPNIDEEVEENGGDYQITSLSNYMRKAQMLQFLVDSYKKEGKNKQMIVFCVDKKHAKEVKLKYEENGYTNISHIDSDTDLNERKTILSNFANNKVQIITCIETLTEGVDLPETKCIQLARPTQSLVLYMQMVGRGSRPKADGSECIILDNSGCTIEHGVPNSPKHWSLNPDINPNNPRKKNRVVGKRKDGTFTEDENEMSFLELVEMTPEEYAMNMDGGIEKSEKFNKESDEKCRQILRDIGNFVLSKLKGQNFKLNEEDIDSNYFDLSEVIIKNNNSYGIKVEYNKNIKFLDISLTSNYYRVEEKNILKTKLKTNVSLGKLCDEFSKDKNNKHIIDLFEEIQDINENKIDINSLKSKAKEFRLEQLKIQAEQHLILNNEIILSKEIGLGSYFRNAWYRNKAKKLIFSKNKLKAVNDIKFISESGEESSFSNVTKEKIIDMLSHGEWKPQKSQRAK